MACGLDRIMDRPEGSGSIPLPSNEAWTFLADALQVDVEAILEEPTLLQTDALLRSGIDAIPPNEPFEPGNCVEPLLGHVAYVICRALHPTTVVETGVAYGSSSTYILAALEMNRHGDLHSIDLPSILDPKANLVGRLIPEGLRSRWHLHLGASRRVLPQLLKTVRSVDLFFHDSLHTRRNMNWEFSAVTPYLTSGSVVLSDDVHWNHTFADWARRTTAQWTTVRQILRRGALGIAITRNLLLQC